MEVSVRPSVRLSGSAHKSRTEACRNIKFGGNNPPVLIITIFKQKGQRSRSHGDLNFQIGKVCIGDVENGF